MSVHFSTSDESPPLSRWPTYQPMVLVLAAFGSGILLDRLYAFEYQISFAGCLVSLVLWWLVNRFWHPRAQDRRNAIGSVLLLIGLVFLGSFWHHGRWNWFGENEIGRFASATAKPCCVEALVVSEPRSMAANSDSSTFKTESSRTKLEIRVTKIRDGVKWKPASGLSDLIIHLPAEHVRAGDRIRVFGRLVSSSPPSNPGQFDFRNFYRAKSKLAFIHAYDLESVQVIEPAKWTSARLLSKLRQRLNDFAWTYVDEEEAAFASAILLGNREQLSRPRRDAFMETGTVHLLAISGLHVGILAGTFFLLFRLGLVSRQKCLWMTIFFVIFYAWLVEFRPPVSRATILIVLFCVGRLCGESHFSFNLLAIAGAIVLIFNPTDLFGIGPQLSFLAVASLTFGRGWVFWKPSRDPIKRLIASTRPFHVRTFNWMGRQFRTAILVSGLIWLVAVPMVAFRFHLVAPVALVINPVLLVPIAWALYGGLGVLVCGWFLMPLANLCGWVCYKNLLLIEWLIGLAQVIPYSHFWTSGPTAWAVSVFYGGVFLFAIYPPSRLRGRWLLTLCLAWLALCWIVPDYVSKSNRQKDLDSLSCTVIDVGHGSSVLLQLPGGKSVLYDAGSLGSSEYGARNIANVLWSERISHLDAVVLSHADVDHFNALGPLVEQFSIEAVFLSPQMLESDSSEATKLFGVLAKQGIPIRKISAGTALSFSDDSDPGANKVYQVKVLGPPVLGTGGNDNSNSLVLLVEHAGKRILLPGDLEREGLDILLEQPPIDCDFVMAAHHGSKNSLPEKFMHWATPEFVAISGGSQRISEAMESRFKGPGREIARTDQDGAIRFEIDANGMRMKGWKNEPW